MPIRRKANPVHVQSVWDSIKYLTSHKTLPDSNRIIKKLTELNGPAQWDNIIEEAVEDNLLEVNARISAESTQTYKIPIAGTPVSDGRDWYCFECHSGGDVVFCNNQMCPRVYHLACVARTAVDKFTLIKNIFNNIDSTLLLKKGVGLPYRRKLFGTQNDSYECIDSSDSNSRQNNEYDKSLCILCNMNKLKDISLKKSELNYLLRFILTRIRSWIPVNIAFKLDTSDHPKWLTNEDFAWRTNYLIYEHIDMSVIEFKIDNDIYTNCHGILLDVLGIRHNIGIFHGVESQEYLASEYVLRDALHDLGEIICCPDCFKHSNEKINVNWFAIPCKQPHEIVWAKQKGYSYWPAKVIKKIDNLYDIRYFGSKHERALLSALYIKPVDIPRGVLQLKKRTTLTKAVEEMELHQKLLGDPVALQVFVSSSQQETSPMKDSSSAPSIPKRSKTPMPSSMMRAVKVENKRGARKRDAKDIKKNNEKSPKNMKMQALVKKESTNSVTRLEELSAPGKGRKRKTEKIEESQKKKKIRASIKQEPLPPFPVKSNSSRKNTKRKTDQLISTSVDEPKDHIKESNNKLKKKAASPRKKENLVEKVSPTKKTKKKKPTSRILDGSIRISDSEDDGVFSNDNLSEPLRGSTSNYEQLEQVTSSTEMRDDEHQSRGHGIQPFSDEVEMLRRRLESIPNKRDIIEYALKFMQKEIDKITEKHTQHLVNLFETHNNQISETKKKQWCYNCEQDAIYHCCWNTAYCSIICQQQHWQAEHKKVCRRKR